jgi:hypothetical protein
VRKLQLSLKVPQNVHEPNVICSWYERRWKGLSSDSFVASFVPSLVASFVDVDQSAVTLTITVPYFVFVFVFCLCLCPRLCCIYVCVPYAISTHVCEQ